MAVLRINQLADRATFDDMATGPAVATGLTVATVLLGRPAPDTVAAGHVRVAADGRSLATAHTTTVAAVAHHGLGRADRSSPGRGPGRNRRRLS